MSVETRVAWRPEAYAGFWQRVGGYLIDALIFFVLFFVIALLLGDDALDPEGGSPVPNLLAGLAFFVYDTVLTAKQGATLGKRAAGIEVRRLDGTLPSYGICVGRYFARVLSGLPLLLGYLWPVFDQRKQTFHDKIVSTVVLKRALVQPAGGAGGSWDAAAPVGTGWGAAGPGSAQGWQAGAPWGAGSTGQWPSSPGSPSAPGAPPPPGAPPASPVGGGQGGGLSGETMETARWGGPSEAPEEPPLPAEPVGPDQERSIAETWGEPAGPPPAGSSAPAASASGPPAAGSAHAAPAGARPSGPDPNVVAVHRAGLSNDSAAWLQQVAAQVDPRLDRVRPDWRDVPQAEAARACAFGILLGHLARVHPHMAGDLGRVAEVHPSFSTLLEGSRLATLEQIAAEPGRATAWLGPLLDVEDRERISALLA